LAALTIEFQLRTNRLELGEHRFKCCAHGRQRGDLMMPQRHLVSRHRVSEARAHWH
jgi:hypothetical protein